MDEKENLSEKSDFDISTFLKFNDPKIKSFEKLNYQEKQDLSIISNRSLAKGSISENETIIKVAGEHNDLLATEISEGAIEIKTENKLSSSKQVTESMHENTILSTAAEDILMNVLNKPIELSADLVTINIGDISPLQSPTKSTNEAMVDDETTDDLTVDSNEVIKVDVTDLVNKNDFIIPDPNFFDKSADSPICVDVCSQDGFENICFQQEDEFPHPVSTQVTNPSAAKFSELSQSPIHCDEYSDSDDCRIQPSPGLLTSSQNPFLCQTQPSNLQTQPLNLQSHPSHWQRISSKSKNVGTDTVTNPHHFNNTHKNANLHTDNSHAIPATQEVVYYDTSAHENMRDRQNITSFGCRSDLQQVEERSPQILQYKYCEKSGFFQPNIPETNQFGPAMNLKSCLDASYINPRQDIKTQHQIQATETNQFSFHGMSSQSSSTIPETTHIVTSQPAMDHLRQNVQQVQHDPNGDQFSVSQSHQLTHQGNMIMQLAHHVSQHGYQPQFNNLNFHGSCSSNINTNTGLSQPEYGHIPTHTSKAKSVNRNTQEAHELIQTETLYRYQLEKEQGQRLSKWKEKVVRTNQGCLVCGSPSSGCHYNVLACEGCKGFFRRTVTKCLMYACKFSKSCQVFGAQRKRCKACRFAACLAHGMSIQCVINRMKKIPDNLEPILALQSAYTNHSQHKKSRKLSESKTSGAPQGSPQGTDMISPSIDAVSRTSSNVSSEEMSPNYQALPMDTPPPSSVDSVGSSMSPEETSSEDWQRSSVSPAISHPISLTRPSSSNSNYSNVASNLQQAISLHAPHTSLAVPTENSLVTTPKTTSPVPSTGQLTQLSKEEFEFIHKLNFFQAQLLENPRPEDLSAIENRFQLEWSVMGRFTSIFLETTNLSALMVLEFCKRLPGLSTLNQQDQVAILKGSSSKNVMLRTARCYSTTTNYVVFSPKVVYNMSQEFFTDDLRPVTSFFNKVLSLELDNVEFAILTAITLFNEKKRVLYFSKVKEVQNTYLILLRTYVKSKTLDYESRVRNILDILDALEYLQELYERIVISVGQTRGQYPKLLTELWHN